MAISGVGTSAADLRAQLEALKQQQEAAKAEKENAEKGKTDKTGAKDEAQTASTEAQENQSTASTNKTDADNIKTEAQTAKELADTNYKIAQDTTYAAKEAEASAKTNWEASCTAITVAQGSVASAKSALESALAAVTEDNPNTAAIAAAEAAVRAAEAALIVAEENEKIANKAYKEAIDAREKAEDAEDEAKGIAEKAAEALKKAETDAEAAAKLLEEAEAALETATANLEKAIGELEEAEKAFTDATDKAAKFDEDVAAKIKELEEAEEAEKKDVNHMSEEDAIANGYTIIPAGISADELREMLIANPNGKFMMMGDIDLDGVNWAPIGSADSPFTGTFDGNGFSIENLNITTDDPFAENLGFFAATDGATIKDVDFKNAKVTSFGYELEDGTVIYLTDNVGIVAGTARGTRFSNVSVSGEVNGFDNVGGVVGYVDDCNGKDSSFDNVHSDVKLDGEYYTGGIIGNISDAGGNLKITNCSSKGNLNVDFMGGGGIIGKAGKRVITVDHCSSSMNIKLGVENPNNYDEGYVGGIIGCADGTYIAICNCTYDGEGLEDYQKSYGGYRNGAHVSVYDVKEGLPKDDILNITFMDGVEKIDVVYDADGNPIYDVSVNTIAGMNNIVKLIQDHPELAEILTYHLTFDFNELNDAYNSPLYTTYGIVETVEGSREEGTVSRNVYFDNEVDAYTEFHAGFNGLMQCNGGKCEFECIFYEETFVKGLYKDEEGNFYVRLKDGTFAKVDIKNNDWQFLKDMTAEEKLAYVMRLTEEQVKQREELVELGHIAQDEMYGDIKSEYGYGKDDLLPNINEAQRAKLAIMAQLGLVGEGGYTDEQKAGMAKYDVDKAVGLAEMEASGNSGCGMGGNAPYLSDIKDPVDKEGFVKALKDIKENLANGKYSY